MAMIYMYNNTLEKSCTDKIVSVLYCVETYCFYFLYLLFLVVGLMAIMLIYTPIYTVCTSMLIYICAASLHTFSFIMTMYVRSPSLLH